MKSIPARSIASENPAQIVVSVDKVAIQYLTKHPRVEGVLF